MNAVDVKTKLIQVLKTIQATSGLTCPPINDTTKPIEALPQFDSKIWPVAIGMLASELGITIPDDENIFRRTKTCIALTISETVAVVISLSASQLTDTPKMVAAK